MNKPKLIPRFPLMTAWGCLFGLVMLVLGLAVGGLISIYALPALWNYDVTQTVAWGRIYQVATAQSAFADALDMTLRAQAAGATQSALALQATEAALNIGLQSTQSALSSNQALLNQTATQSQRFVLATLTAQAVQNEQQRTQIALDYAATQVALQQNATQVELNFQATQAALGNNPAAVNQNTPVTSPTFSSQSAPAMATPSATLYLTPTSRTPVLLPPTDTPVPTSTRTVRVPSATPVALSVDFADGLDAALWNVADSEDWQQENNGIRALRAGAWLLSKSQFSGDYTLTLTFVPALVDKADYVVLLNTNEAAGLTLTLQSQALTVTQLNLTQRGGVIDEVVITQPASVPLTGSSRLTVIVKNRTIMVTLNNQNILFTGLLDEAGSGQFGVRFPQNAMLTHLEIAAP